LTSSPNTNALGLVAKAVLGVSGENGQYCIPESVSNSLVKVHLPRLTALARRALEAVTVGED